MGWAAGGRRRWIWTSTMWMWKRQLSEEEGRKPKLDRREGAREKERETVGELKRVVENERDRERETRSLRGSKLWIGLRGPRVRVNGWQPGDPRG